LNRKDGKNKAKGIIGLVPESKRPSDKILTSGKAWDDHGYKWSFHDLNEKAGKYSFYYYDKNTKKGTWYKPYHLPMGEDSTYKIRISLNKAKSNGIVTAKID